MTADVLVSGVEVRVGGTALDPLLAGQLLEVRVETHLMLPDMVTLRVPDPDIRIVDHGPFKIGAPIEVLFRPPDLQRQTSIFDGQITSIEPDFGEDGAILGVRGYDGSHQLNRTPRTETYQSLTFGDIAVKVASRSRLSRGTIDDSGRVHDFVQQSNETDWRFLWRLATAIGFEVVVDGRRLHFRRPGGSAGTEPVPLAWGRELLSFRPRATAVGQVPDVVVRGWSPADKKEIVETARRPATNTQIGISRAQLAGAFGGGPVAVCDHPVASAAHAHTVATGIAEQLANSFVQADGLAHGDPRLRAGVKIRVSGVGASFGGVYALSETTHVFRSARGYHTELRVSGRAVRGLASLASGSPSPSASPGRSGWEPTVVVGIVTNNRDPAKLGRVRVRYPTLADGHEGWWARVVVPAAGPDRGLLMMPVVGEEVLVAFEHGAAEFPYVLGSVFNGVDVPASLVHPDGSFALRSDKQLIAHAADQITIAGDQAVGLEAGSDMTLKATGKLGQSAEETSIKANTGLTLEGVQSAKMTGLQVAIDGETTTAVKAG
ncbi:MAG TPA: VgrG-related protein, partial [Solirubrobacteraceae bacterium]|nr:VgrG-related protein [Solirubrobacteraceae bacterium]